MLSQKTIDIVKSTVPVLEQHGVAITTTFYRNMFAAHPELLNIFNHVNQSQGRQQTALANMVLAAAKHIDELDVIVPAVVQVAHKHRGLQVQPEHYPIVGKFLLEAIKEVLGDAATDDIINAWAEAYGVIAQAFIDVEQNMYNEAEKEAGWKDFKDFEVVRKEQESDVITSFYLKAKDGMKTPKHLPGQYITVRINIPGEEYALNRQYSLSAAPGKETFRISVKKENDNDPNGKVSNYLHEHIQVGDSIEVSAPAGVFTLNMEETAPVALISGGVGLTPMMSMFEALADTDTDRKVTFIHSARNENVHAFKKEVQELAARMKNANVYFGYSEASSAGDEHFTGYITEEFLKNKLTADTICYVCGPVPFLNSVVTMLGKLGIAKDKIRFEFFGPAMAIQDAEKVTK